MKTNPLTPIRPARSHDAAALSDLFGQLGFPCTTDEVLVRLGEAGDVALVAAIGERVVGVVTTSVMRVLHRPMPVGRISALVVSEEHRGRGVGQALVAAAEALLAGRGCGMIEVTSNVRLERAHAFYRSLGYETTSYRFKKDLQKTTGG